MIILRSKINKCPDCVACNARSKEWGGIENNIGIFSCYDEECKAPYQYFGEKMSMHNIPLTYRVRWRVNTDECPNIASFRKKIPSFPEKTRQEIATVFANMGIPENI